MVLWETTSKLPPQYYYQQVLDVYKNKQSFFPLEVRQHLSEWIEKYILINIDTDDPEQAKYMKDVMSQFLEQVRRALSLQQTKPEVRIQNILQEILVVYTKPRKPMIEYFRAIRECLLEEMRIVTRYEAERRCLEQIKSHTRSTSFLSMRSDDEIFVQLLAEAGGSSEYLLGRIRELENEQRTFGDMYEEGEKISRTVAQMEATHWNEDVRSDIHVRQSNLQDYIENKVQTVMKLRQKVADCAELLVNDLAKLTKITLGFFEIWRTEHGPGTISGDAGIELDALQECYERTYRSVFEILVHLARAKRLHTDVEIDSSFIFCEQIDSLHSQSSELIRSLTERSAIVEVEPPQLVEPNMRFSAMVRIFMPEHLKNLNVKGTAYFVDQQLARTIFEKGMTNAPELGKYGLLNGQGELQEFDDEERIFRVKFGGMKVTSDAVSSSKGAFWLAFRIQYLTTDGNVVTEAWTSSLAIAIVKSTSEISKAGALVTWDNAFAGGSVIEKFTVRWHVPWNAYGNLLSKKFKGVTGRGLSAHDLCFLARMIFNKEYTNFGHRTVTYELQHENLCKRNFSFWQWFVEAMKLAQKSVNQFWQACLIPGFISLQQARASLRNYSMFVGTFIVMFSTRELGAVDIVYIKDFFNNKIECLTFTSTELDAKPLHIRLMNLTELRFFFPKAPKEKTLQEWCSDSCCRGSLVWGIGSVQQAKLMLGSKSPIGTFVAVLSRSQAGAVDLVWVAGTGRDRFKWTTFTRTELNEVPLHHMVMAMKELKYLLYGSKPNKEDVVKKCFQGRNQGTKPNTSLMIDLSSDEVRHLQPLICLSDNVESVHLTATNKTNDVSTEFMDTPPQSSQNELSPPTLSSIESRMTPESCQSIEMNDNVKKKDNNDAIMYNAKENDYDDIMGNVKEMNNMNNTFEPQLDDILSCTEISHFMGKSNSRFQPKYTMPHENTLNEEFPAISRNFPNMGMPELVEYFFQDVSTNISSPKDLPNRASNAKSISSNFDISKNKSLSPNTPALNDLENICNSTVFCENKADHQSIPSATSPKALELGTESISKNALCNPSAASSKFHYNNILTKTDASDDEPSTTESFTRSFLKEVSLDANASCDGSHLKRNVSTGHTSNRELLPTNYPHVTNALNAEPPNNNIHPNTDVLPSQISFPYFMPEITTSHFMSLLQKISCTGGALSNSMNTDTCSMTMSANNNNNPVRFNPQNGFSNMNVNSVLHSQDTFHRVGVPGSAPPRHYMLANAHNQSLLKPIDIDPNVITNGK